MQAEKEPSGLASNRSRTRIQVYHDILHACHVFQRAGEKVTLNGLGYEARLPTGRLKERVAELRAIGLLDSGYAITSLGYAYLHDYTRNVAPFLRRFGLEARRRP